MASDQNREAIERMFARVVAAGKRVGMTDDELHLMLDDILLGDGVRPAAPEKLPEPQAVGQPVPQPAEGKRKPGPDSLIPELDEPLPDGGIGATTIVDGDQEVTLESLGLGRVTMPVRLAPPPKTDWDKHAEGSGPLKPV